MDSSHGKPTTPTDTVPKSPSRDGTIKSQRLVSTYFASNYGAHTYGSDVLFLTSLVVLSTIFLAAGLAIYLWAVHTTYREGWDLISTADLQFVVTISQVMSTLLPKMVPIVMSIYTYRVAAIWLAQSDDSLERPTPLQ